MKTALGVALVVVAGAVAGVGRADVIELRDGRTFQGKLTPQGEMAVITTEEGALVEVGAAAVLKVTDVTPANLEEKAGDEWKRVAARVRLAGDLRSILVLHENYLRVFGTAKAAAEGRASLANFEKLAAAGAVKIRDKWMSPEEMKALRAKWEAEAKAATGFYQEGRMKEALEAVRVALGKNDQNPVALAVGGLAAYRANNLGLARVYFTQLAGFDPTSLLAENNLAVLYFQQKQEPQMVAHYLRALQIDPKHRLVLDNITEMIRSYTGPKAAPNYVALVRQYEQAESKLEAVMAGEKMHRWGATWAGNDDYEKMISDRKKTQDEMAQLDADFKSTKAMLVLVTEQVKKANDEYEVYAVQMQTVNTPTSSYTTRGAAGMYVNAAAQTAMQNLEKAKARKAALEAQQTQLKGKMEQFTTKAARLKQALADDSPQFLGVQRVMDLGEDEKAPPVVAIVKAQDVPVMEEKGRGR